MYLQHNHLFSPIFTALLNDFPPEDIKVKVLPETEYTYPDEETKILFASS